MSTDFDRIEQRAVVKFLTSEGSTPAEIKIRMDNVYQDSRPVEVKTPDKIQLISKLVEGNYFD